MPWCQPDEDLGYYGFLTTGLRVQRGVLNHLRSYDRASITFVTRQWLPPRIRTPTLRHLRGAGRRKSHVPPHPRRPVSEERLVLGQGVRQRPRVLDRFRHHGSGGYIQFQRPDEESHKVIEDYKLANGGNMIVVPLNANEFIASYTMDLGPYNATATSPPRPRISWLIATAAIRISTSSCSAVPTFTRGRSTRPSRARRSMRAAAMWPMPVTT